MVGDGQPPHDIDRSPAPRVRTVTAVETQTRDEESIGERSRRMLAELQARVLESGDLTRVVLVEGLSDAFALQAAADTGAWNLDGVGVFPMGGATNVGHFARVFGPEGRDLRVVGLCDLAEAPLYARHVGHVFACDRDLEDELIRALGPTRVEELIEGEGDLGSFRTLQQMPFHRGRTIEEHLHRFLGVRSGRKHRYAALLTRTLAPHSLPRPLRDLLDHVRGDA
jgi:hypothetical protein